MEESSLDSDSLGPVGERFFEFAMHRMKGQETAIRRLAKALDHAESPLRSKDKPIYTVLLVGGAGSGKTHLAKILAEFWFGNPEWTISIKCSEFQQTNFSQNILTYHDYLYQLNHGPHKESMQLYAKLIREESELAERLAALKESAEKELGDKNKTQLEKELSKLDKDISDTIARLLALQTEVQPVLDNLRSILVLDHIECANSGIQEALYDMLESGERKMYIEQEGHRKVSLVNSVIFITCSDWIKMEDGEVKKKPLGFETPQTEPKKKLGNSIHLAGMDELKEYLSPKILSRIVRVEFLRSYDERSRLEIVDILIAHLVDHLLANDFTIGLKISDEVKKFIVQEGSDHPKLGIRLLKQKFDKYITWKLENLVQKGLIRSKDTLEIILGEPVKDRHRVIFRKIDVLDSPPE